MSTNTETTPKTATEHSENERHRERATRKRRAIVLGIWAVGAAAWTYNINAFVDGDFSREGVEKIVSNPFESHEIDTDPANVEKYRDWIDMEVQGSASLTLDRSPSHAVDVVYNADSNPVRRGYVVDDDPNTRYGSVENHPNIVKALDYVHPALLAASGVEEIQLKSLEHANGIDLPGEDIIVLNKEHASYDAPEIIADTITHELGHSVHEEAGQGKYARIPAFENENPPYFSYKDEVDENQFYDGAAMSKGVTVRDYGTTNHLEDFATHVEAIFDQAPDYGSSNAPDYLGKLKTGNELTKDKTAVVLDVLDKVNPSLGTIGYDQIENRLDERL